ncbi:MAG: glycosyltransferase family 2 protein [Proteobacteria bacterium]|nr:MAG: glycosyltransferase family 2 protein [Pseudomonadota bacterium]
MTPRYCAIIPTYDNPATVARVAASVREFLPDVFVVDDGSAAPGNEAVRELGERGIARVHFREHNGGKGAAVLSGLELAQAAGFTHALQIDADGQHDTGDVPRLLEASRLHPQALVLGQPLFDESAPKSRRRARKITHVLCAIEAGSLAVGDPLCGFRVYPVAASLAARARGRKMDFDPEVAVKLSWNRTPIVHVEVKVRYFTAAEGGVSHYQLVRDTARIGWMHVRLCTWALLRALTWPVRALLPAAPAPEPKT